MHEIQPHNLIILALQGSIISVTVLLFYRLKEFIGVTVIYICLGLMHFHSTLLLSSSLQVGVYPSLSPGSISIQSAALFGLLLIYIKEDAGECRQLLYGIPAASLFLGLLLFLFSISSRGESISYLGVIVPWNRLIQSIMIEAIMFTLSGLALLLIFETLSQKTANKLLWLRLFVAGIAAFVVDGIASFFLLPRELPLPIEMLPVDLFMRVFICVIYATLMYTYLRIFESEKLMLADNRTLREVWEVLSFRKPFEFFVEERQKDQLTGVYNRAFLARVLPGEVLQANRTNRPLTLVRIDFDRFKKYNEEAGHFSGDNVLRAFAKYLQSLTRSSDLVVRSSGQEFMLLLANIDQSQTVEILQKVRSEANEVLDSVWQASAPKTLSMGIASFPEDAKTVRKLLDVSADRLYLAKRSGGNLIVNASGKY